MKDRLLRPLRVLLLNLDEHQDRFIRVREMFDKFPGFRVERISGVLASDLPAVARDY